MTLFGPRMGVLALSLWGFHLYHFWFVLGVINRPRVMTIERSLTGGCG